jgi:hypothetical protein
VSKRYVITEEKDHSGWWIILVAAFLVAYGKAILVGAITAGILFLAYQLFKWYRKHQAVQQVEEAYNYVDPPTKLITEGMYVWGNPEHYLDNYDDGMREWA